MTPRWKSALLWGGVGTLVFLVSHQAYLLFLDGNFVGYLPVAAVALAVFAVATVGSYYVEESLPWAAPTVDDSGVDGPPSGVSSGSTSATESADAEDEDGWIWGEGSSESDREGRDGST